MKPVFDGRSAARQPFPDLDLVDRKQYLSRPAITLPGLDLSFGLGNAHDLCAQVDHLVARIDKSRGVRSRLVKHHLTQGQPRKPGLLSEEFRKGAGTRRADLP